MKEDRKRRRERSRERRREQAKGVKVFLNLEFEYSMEMHTNAFAVLDKKVKKSSRQAVKTPTNTNPSTLQCFSHPQSLSLSLSLSPPLSPSLLPCPPCVNFKHQCLDEERLSHLALCCYTRPSSICISKPSFISVSVYLMFTTLAFYKLLNHATKCSRGKYLFQNIHSFIMYDPNRN